MDNEELVKLFEDRFKDYNTKVLKELGSIIGKFDGLTYSEAYKLGQQLKYSISIKDLERELSKISGKSLQDIKKVLESVAKDNLQFADIYYKARGIDTPIYEQNKALNDIVNGIYQIGGETFENITKTTGFRLLGTNNTPLLLNIDETYKKVIDECVYALSTGQETYDQVSTRLIKQLSSSGVRKIDYGNGYSRRLDSTVRMNVLDGMRQVSNEVQKQVGKEFDSDGVEISVHLNPAPDHALVQGHQFSNEEFDNFQNDRVSYDYKGNRYEPEFDGHDRRSISEYNCYHYVFSIILGVNNPEYTEEQLKEIRNNANKEIVFDGKTYTMYEATQLQRNIETQIRYAKDEQIMSLEANKTELVGQNQKKISQLTTKYKQLCKISGLPNKLSTRAKVSWYKRVKV